MRHRFTRNLGYRLRKTMRFGVLHIEHIALPFYKMCYLSLSLHLIQPSATGPRPGLVKS
jgi:hypothetical protein